MQDKTCCAVQDPNCQTSSADFHNDYDDDDGADDDDDDDEHDSGDADPASLADQKLLVARRRRGQSQTDICIRVMFSD